MIRPKNLQDYLINILKDFTEFEGIFLTLSEGSIVTSTLNQNNFFFSALTSLWEDCTVIAKLKLYGEDAKQPLQKCIIEHDQGNVILCGLHDMFVLGFCVKKDRNFLAYALEKVELIKSAVEKQLAETIIIQQKDEEMEKRENQDDYDE